MDKTAICHVKGCDRKVLSKGMCRLHYDRQRKRPYFSLNEGLKKSFAEFSREVKLHNDNATLNELIRMGFAYHKLRKKTEMLFKGFEELR